MAQLLDLHLLAFMSLLCFFGGVLDGASSTGGPSVQVKGISKISDSERHPVTGDDTPFPSNNTEWEIFPTSELQNHYINESRRRLGEFQICALCTCCSGLRRFCIPTACCYTITCGSPDKPFGLCSFTPVACNCFNCHL